MDTPSPIFLAGPTAAGKSALAIELAGRLDGEIISVDSMQVYSGLDIGTAKPSADDRRRVRHYMIDVVTPAQGFDAAQFVRLAGAAARDIQGRGRRPIFCGGTGLYFKAWLEGLGEAPPSDAKIRAELQPRRWRNCWRSWSGAIRRRFKPWTAAIRAGSSARWKSSG